MNSSEESISKRKRYVRFNGLEFQVYRTATEYAIPDNAINRIYSGESVNRNDVEKMKDASTNKAYDFTVIDRDRSISFAKYRTDNAPKSNPKRYIILLGFTDESCSNTDVISHI